METLYTCQQGDCTRPAVKFCILCSGANPSNCFSCDKHTRRHQRHNKNEIHEFDDLYFSLDCEEIVCTKKALSNLATYYATETNHLLKQRELSIHVLVQELELVQHRYNGLLTELTAEFNQSDCYSTETNDLLKDREISVQVPLQKLEGAQQQYNNSLTNLTEKFKKLEKCLSELLCFGLCRYPVTDLHVQLQELKVNAQSITIEPFIQEFAKQGFGHLQTSGSRQNIIRRSSGLTHTIASNIWKCNKDGASNPMTSHFCYICNTPSSKSINIRNSR